MVLLQDCGVKAAPGRLPFQTQLTGQLHNGCLPANMAEACRTEQPASASVPAQRPALKLTREAQLGIASTTAKGRMSEPKAATRLQWAAGPLCSLAASSAA